MLIEINESSVKEDTVWKFLYIRNAMVPCTESFSIFVLACVRKLIKSVDYSCVRKES